MSNAAVTWAWALFANRKRYGGRVLAVDPRDAVSRALTSATDSGRLLGEECAVPVAFIDRAPGNGDHAFTVEEAGIRLEVRRLVSSVEHPDLARKVQRLRCTCCGGEFRGRQFANQDTGHGLGDCCVDFVIPRTVDLEGTYGVHGVHYCLPQS